MLWWVYMFRDVSVDLHFGGVWIVYVDILFHSKERLVWATSSVFIDDTTAFFSYSIWARLELHTQMVRGSCV